MRYQDLDVYKRAYSLAIEMHKWSLKLPRELQYDLGSQVRRASRSIPSNIAEGLGKHLSQKDKKFFLSISLGSNDEVIFNLNFMRDVGLMEDVVYEKLSQEYIICGKQINRLIQATSN